MRTFLAIEVPECLKKKIDQLIIQEKNNELPIKWTKYENLHITLKFLGEIDETMKQKIIPVLEKISKNFSPFKIGLSDIGCFPHPGNPRVLWIGVKQGASILTDIAGEIDKALYALGFIKDKRFHGHLTIGRTKKHCRIDHILTREFTSEEFTVDSVTLFRSSLTPQGPQYEILNKFSFE